MYAIPIIPATIDLIKPLNGGVRPQEEDQPTFFVWNGEDMLGSIVNTTELYEIASNWKNFQVQVI